MQLIWYRAQALLSFRYYLHLFCCTVSLQIFGIEKHQFTVTIYLPYARQHLGTAMSAVVKLVMVFLKRNSKYKKIVPGME